MQKCAAGGAVAGAHGAAVGLDDRFADGQADAHVAALVGDGLLVAGEVAVEQVREQGGGDPLPVVGDLEDGEIFAARQAQGDLKGAIDAYAMAGTVDLLRNPVPFLFAAKCYIQLGDRENAVGALKGLLTLGEETNPQHADCHKKARALLTMLNASE